MEVWSTTGNYLIQVIINMMFLGIVVHRAITIKWWLELYIQFHQHCDILR